MEDSAAADVVTRTHPASNCMGRISREDSIVEEEDEGEDKVVFLDDDFHGFIPPPPPQPQPSTGVPPPPPPPVLKAVTPDTLVKILKKERMERPSISWGSHSTALKVEEFASEVVGEAPDETSFPPSHAFSPIVKRLSIGDRKRLILAQFGL